MMNERQLNRRDLMRWSVAAAAGMGVTGWLGACFATDEDAAREGAEGPVLDAWRAAREQGRPLLVLVIPSDDSLKGARGDDWGTLFLHAPLETQAELASFEVVCSTIDEAQASLPKVRDVPGDEASAFVVEAGAGSARSVDLDHSREECELDWDGWEEQDAAVASRLQRQAEALNQFLTPSADVLLARAKQSRAALGSEAPMEGAAFDASLAERAPAIVRSWAEQAGEAERLQWLTALADCFRAKYAVNSPRGAHWATSSGCGIDIEGCEDGGSGISCGMAMIPELSQRFLYFYKLEGEA
jgi:hypothetical protein